MPADVVAYYGADFISGVIIIGGNPYKSMFEQVAKTEAVGLIQRVLTTDMNLWHQAGKDFIASLVAYPNRMPTETKYMWLGAVAGQSRKLFSLTGSPAVKSFMTSNCPKSRCCEAPEP